MTAVLPTTSRLVVRRAGHAIGARVPKPVILIDSREQLGYAFEAYANWIGGIVIFAEEAHATIQLQSAIHEELVVAHLYQKAAGRQSPSYFCPEDNSENYDFVLLRREKLCRRCQAAAATARSEAMAWARDVPIVVTPLPADLRARAYFGHYVEHAGLEAFVRHCFSNYEALLPRLRAWPPAAFAQRFPERSCRRPGYAGARCGARERLAGLH
jgi:hypothetical protein